MGIRMDPTTLEGLEYLASRENVSLSEYVRDILKTLVKQRTKEQNHPCK